MIAHKNHFALIVPDGMEVSLSSPMETEQQPTEPENPTTSGTAGPPLLDVHGNLGCIGEQPHTPDLESVSHIHAKVVQAIRCLGFDCNDNAFNLQRSLVECVPELCTRVPPGSDPPTIRSSAKKPWTKSYSALSFLMNGQLFAEYERVSNMLGIPSCSKNQWLRIVEWTEKRDGVGGVVL